MRINKTHLPQKVKPRVAIVPPANKVGPASSLSV